MTRAIVVLAAALLVLLVSREAGATLAVSWDCYLPTGSVDCVALENGLTSKIPFVAIVSDPRRADVSVTITSLPAEDGTRYTCDFLGKRIDGYATEVHTTDKIPSSIDATTATVRLMTKLERGLDDFMDQKIAAEVKNGRLSIELLDPSRLPFSGRPQQTAVKWYVAPAIGSYLNDVSGVGVNASGTATVAFNDSEPRWRAQQTIGASYSQQSQPVPGTNETATISFAGASTTDVLSAAISRDGHWNAGVLYGAEKNPQGNYRFRTNASAGLEFDVVPRQTVNQKNLGTRCAVGPELQRYDAINVEHRDRETLVREACDAYVSWHFARVDVAANVSETVLLESFDYRSLSAGLSAAWRVTDNLTVAPWFGVQQIEKAVNEAEPSNVVYSDPREEIRASMLAAVQRGYTAPFGFQSGLSVKYLFGNGTLASEDQRWKGASSLR